MDHGVSMVGNTVKAMVWTMVVAMVGDTVRAMVWAMVVSMEVTTVEAMVRGHSGGPEVVDVMFGKPALPGCIVVGCRADG